MYSDYNESTRRFINPGKIKYFWDQQRKVAYYAMIGYGIITMLTHETYSLYNNEYP